MRARGYGIGLRVAANNRRESRVLIHVTAKEPLALSLLPSPPSTSSRLTPYASPPAPYGLFVVTAAATLVADVLTKLWAVRVLEVEGRGAIEIVRGNVELVLARNPGAAFSVMRDAPEWVRRPLFIGVSLLAVFFVTRAYRRLDANRRAARWGFAFVLGGALGNLVDRVRDAAVVDFIQVHGHLGAAGREIHWPTFNAADVAICAGVALLAFDLFRSRAPSPLADDPHVHDASGLDPR
jgi:signal peptidase II